MRWRESLLALAEQGIGTIVELGSRRVLCGLAKRTLEGVATAALGTPEEIDAYVETLPVLGGAAWRRLGRCAGATPAGHAEKAACSI